MSKTGMACEIMLLNEQVKQLQKECDRKDAALRAALEISDWGRGGITQMAFFQASCERVSGAIRSALSTYEGKSE